MTPERRALIVYRLERARQALVEAEALLKIGHANACVNRLYYANFYAVSALFPWRWASIVTCYLTAGRRATTRTSRRSK